MDGVVDERLLAPETTDAFLWIVIVGGIGAFFAAFGIGANDVANAFATSVGAKAITLKQAVVLAGVFEFLGAVLMGSHVTKTIRKGIVDVRPMHVPVDCQAECFTDNPPILMYGMMCVVYTTGLWLLTASFFELPVSTTHSTVGGIVGMGMTYRGPKCVNWHEDTDTFPFMKGISAIVLSWVISPVFSGILATILFATVRQFVLRSESSFKRSFIVFPLLVAATVTVNVFFIVYKGAKGLDLDETPLNVAFAWAFGLGIGVAILMIPTLLPYIYKTVRSKYTEEGILRTSAPSSATSPDTVGDMQEEGHADTHVKGGIIAFVNGQLNQDIHRSVKESETVSTIHERAERFHPNSEEVFKYMQVFTAICDSFSHGANDVANAMGPFAAIYVVYTTGEVRQEGELGTSAYWILVIGGLGIVAGLGLYGYKIIGAIGVKICKITPSRGFAIELGAAMVILIGSRLEIPLSTTHCQVGATAGVAILEGIGGLNMTVLSKAIFGWVATLVVCGIMAAVLFSQGAYAPYAFDVTPTNTASL
ncbi:unnamed protein product [Discosporangium mesarthrocarpum]